MAESITCASQNPPGRDWSIGSLPNERERNGDDHYVPIITKTQTCVKKICAKKGKSLNKSSIHFKSIGLLAVCLKRG